MPSYPAKPFEIPNDDWFNNNSINLENNSETKGTKNITIIHEFFYRQSDVKIGGSENQIKTNLEKKSSSIHFFKMLRAVWFLQAEKNIVILKFLQNLNQ